MRPTEKLVRPVTQEGLVTCSDGAKQWPYNEQPFTEHAIHFQVRNGEGFVRIEAVDQSTGELLAWDSNFRKLVADVEKYLWG